jgi:hypothetical protein
MRLPIFAAASFFDRERLNRAVFELDLCHIRFVDGVDHLFSLIGRILDFTDADLCDGDFVQDLTVILGDGVGERL